VRFADDFTGLVFRPGQLDDAVAASDSSLRPYTHEFLRRVVSFGGVTAAAQATEAVEFLLPAGRCSVQQVSRHLGLQPRELQRRLAEEGSSFSAIVHAARTHLAEQSLPTNRSLTEISQMLGFAAPSAFSRWFSQHFGMSPSAWRSAVRTGSVPVLAAARTTGRPGARSPSYAPPVPRSSSQEDAEARRDGQRQARTRALRR
jgi:AraC-like DNA-binding protein